MSTNLRHNTPSFTSTPAPAPHITPPQGYTEAAKSVFDRIRHGVRRASSHGTAADHLNPKLQVTRSFGPRSKQTTHFRTGLKVRALDINQARTHVVLAGGKILKTVRINDIPSCSEEFNLRTAAVNFPTGPASDQESDHNVRLQQELLDTAALNRETFDIEDVAWSNNEYKDSIATAARNGKIMLYNIHRPGMDIARLHEHLQQVHKVDFNPLEGGVLLSGSQDGTVRLWDLRSLQKSAMICSSREIYQGRSQSVRHVKWSPTSTWTFAFSTDNGGIQRWDTRNNRTPLLKIIAHDGHCNTIDWHPDGRHLASAGEDKIIKIWNLASDEPRTKPIYSVRAPYGVQNVRWRPSCVVTEGSDTGIKKCTHFATSYRHYPVVHVWDLRRPLIPFREIHHTHNSGTTDMLWRTRDLLWTVGPEGEFTQTDVPFAPKTIDRRPTSTLSVAATGEMNLYIMKRQPHFMPENELDARRRLAEDPVDSQTHNSLELPFGRSPGDDSVDERFVGSGNYARLSRTPSYKSPKSIEGTPPSIEDTAKSDTVDLALAMHNFDRNRTTQVPKIGPLPGAESELITTYMAQKCKGPPTDLALNLDHVLNIRTLFEQNGTYAQRASRYREAQTWRILGAQVETDIRDRAVANRRKRLSVKPRDGVAGGDTASLNVVRAAQHPRSRSQSHISYSSQALKTVLDPNTLKTRAARAPESTSNMTTPLARPADELVNGATEVMAHVAEVNGDIQLPPSATTHYGRDRATEEGTVPKPSKAASSSSSGHFVDAQRPNLNRHTSSDSFMFSMSTDSDSRMSKAASIGSNQDRMRSVESENANTASSDHSPVDYSTSFTGSQSHIFPASYDESDIQFPTQCAQTGVEGEKTVPANAPLSAASGQSGAPQPQEVSLGITPVVQAAQIHTRPPIVPGITQVQYLHPHPPPPSPQIQPRGVTDDVPPLNLDDVTAPAPYAGGWNSEGMLKQLLDFYVTRGEFRLASQLFLLSASVLTPVQARHDSQEKQDPVILTAVEERTGSGNEVYDYLVGPPLNMTPVVASDVVGRHRSLLKAFQYDPWRIEAFLSVYHEQLLSRNLLNPAAVLRKQSYPAFPAVYDQALIDTYIGLLCTACNNAINNTTNRMLCETCGDRQAPCCICWLTNSPFESSYGAKTPQRGTDSPLPLTAPAVASNAIAGANIWACCVFCNHSAHVACISAWFADAEAHGACPTQGCGCECLWGGSRSGAADGGVERDWKGKMGSMRKDGPEGRERTVRFLEEVGSIT